jgi:hypothetical protein
MMLSESQKPRPRHGATPRGLRFPLRILDGKGGHVLFQERPFSSVRIRLVFEQTQIQICKQNQATQQKATDTNKSE